MPRLSGQFFNVFSPSAIKSLISILSRVTNQPIREDQIYTNGFKRSDMIYPAIDHLVLGPLRQVSEFPIGDLTVGMQLKAKTPFGLHTDYMKDGDDGGGMAWLIPLYIDSDNASAMTSTVIFNQHWDAHISVDDYIKTNPKRPTNPAHDIWHLLPNRDRPHQADFFSVQTLANWVPGSVIYWDRSLFHTSDDFRLQNIREKSALVLFNHC